MSGDTGVRPRGYKEVSGKKWAFVNNPILNSPDPRKLLMEEWSVRHKDTQSQTIRKE